MLFAARKVTLFARKFSLKKGQRVADYLLQSGIRFLSFYLRGQVHTNQVRSHCEVPEMVFKTLSACKV